MPAPSNPVTSTHAGACWRQPVLWLGVLTFIASLAGCVWILLVSLQHADPPVDAAHTVFGVPASTHSSRGAPP